MIITKLTRKTALYKLNFEKHVTALCKKAGHQLNALSRIHKYIGFQEMECYLSVYILKF